MGVNTVQFENSDIVAAWIATDSWTKLNHLIPPVLKYQKIKHFLLKSLPITVQLNAGKITSTEQQYSVISNINDIKIYIPVILQHYLYIKTFCNSINLLVSSAQGSKDRTLSLFQKKDKIEMAHIYHIHILKNSHLMALVCLSTLWDCLTQNPLLFPNMLFSRMVHKKITI